MITTTETAFLVSRFWTVSEPVTLTPLAACVGRTVKFERAILEADACETVANVVSRRKAARASDRSNILW